MKQAKVYYNNILAGLLTETDEGYYRFIYEDGYFLNAAHPAIGVHFPKTEQHYYSENLFPFFYNMLSEGANRKIQCRILKIDEEDDFELLLKTGGSETIGAIRVEEIK